MFRLTKVPGSVLRMSVPSHFQPAISLPSLSIARFKKRIESNRQNKNSHAADRFASANIGARFF